MIDQIYIELKALGFVKTHNRFSTTFLGRSARYYDYLRCSGAEVSITALTTLAVRVTNLADHFRHHGRSPHMAETLDRLDDKLWAEVERRSYKDAWKAKRACPARAAEGASDPELHADTFGA